MDCCVYSMMLSLYDEEEYIHTFIVHFMKTVAYSSNYLENSFFMKWPRYGCVGTSCFYNIKQTSPTIAGK